MFECVVNISEGRLATASELAWSARRSLCDVHADAVHHRSVVTLINERDELRRDVRALISATMERLDLRSHRGVHPRFGVVDVVPFVALDDEHPDDAEALRDETAEWIATSFEVPVYLYGPQRDGATRTLPDVRRGAFAGLTPDFGPSEPHPQRGASAVGARDILVAWNLWVRGVSLDAGRAIARALRSEHVRSLAFAIDPFVQISCNLVAPAQVGPEVVYDRVVALLAEGVIDHAELVGLAPDAVLAAAPQRRWAELGLARETTIEARVASRRRA